MTTVTGDTNSGTVSKTGGSATANITNPTVKINKSGKFVPKSGGANYGVTTEQPTVLLLTSTTTGMLHRQQLVLVTKVL